MIFNSPAKNAVEVDLDRLTKIIALRKGIPLEAECFTTLKDAILKIFLLERLISSVISRAKTPFDPSKDGHLLAELWRALNPGNEKVPPIPSEEWKELGFQGDDPATDFRGMGLLGLDQLVSFATKSPKSAHNILQQSKYGSAWYSFAPVGINITALIYGWLVSHSADEYFYQVGPERTNFDAIYARVFETFNEYWVLEEAKDVMDFSRIFGKLRSDIEQNLAGSGRFFQD